jgi:hypothetical protein
VLKTDVNDRNTRVESKTSKKRRKDETRRDERTREGEIDETKCEEDIFVKWSERCEGAPSRD